jgi:superfamily I DNA/RNA helicase
VKKILFTAHSSALINYAQKLLTQLLADDLKSVEIKTVDSEITSYYLSKYNTLPIPTQEQYLAYLDQAVKKARDNHNFTGNRRNYWYASFETINSIGLDYLLREIIEVIEACGLVSQQEYLQFNSVTRITNNDKEFIWAVYQQFKQLLATNGFTTPEQYRIKSLELAKQDKSIKKYDALVIDETQDLSPVSLNFILETVKNKKMSLSPQTLLNRFIKEGLIGVKYINY